MKKTSILRNVYLDELFKGQAATGNVFGDKRFKEGQQITTSKILYVTQDFIETENTRYQIESWANPRADIV